MIDAETRKLAADLLGEDADDEDIDAEAVRLTAVALLGLHCRTFHGGWERPEICSTCDFLMRQAWLTATP